MLEEVNNVIEYLKSKMEPMEYTRVNDLVGCFIDIYDSLERGDLEYANEKLYLYFGEEELYAGNESTDGYSIYLSSYDKQEGAVEFYLEKAIGHVYKNY